jgi:hypothetical protein
MQEILNVAHLAIAIFALLDAIDLMKESWAIFKKTAP